MLAEIHRIGNFVGYSASLWLYLNPCISKLASNLWSVHYTDQHDKSHSEIFNDKTRAYRFKNSIKKFGIFAHP